MTAGRYAQSKAMYVPALAEGPGSELFLVEGDSAARSVCAVRDARTQAVLPLQGKPLNAWKATPARVAGDTLFQQLASALGLESPVHPASALAGLRHARVLLLFDPDADGIHIGALMLLYFARFQPALLDAGYVWMVRAPMFTLLNPATGEEAPAFSTAHRDALVEQWTRQHPGPIDVHRHVGLGSLPAALLRHWCVDARTRQGRVVGAEDIAAVRAALGV